MSAKTTKYPQRLPTFGEVLSVPFLQALFDHLTAVIEDHTSWCLPHDHYGLLPLPPSATGQQKLRKFDLRINENILEISNCFALTPGGTLIVMLEEFHPGLSADLENLDWQKKQEVSLTASSYKRVPQGEIEGIESSFRHPFTLPEYSLEIKPYGEIDLTQAKDAIKIGELNKVGERIDFSPFIPPCTYISAYPALLQQYKDWNKLFYEIIYPTVLHLMHLGRSEERNSTFYANLRQFGQRLRYYLTSEKFRFQCMEKTGRPADLLAFCVGFSGIFSDALEEISNRYHPGLERYSGKDEILLYFEHNSRMSSGRPMTAASFTVSLKKANELDFDPENLIEAISILRDLLDQIKTIFLTLKEIDGFPTEDFWEQSPIIQGPPSAQKGGLW